MQTTAQTLELIGNFLEPLFLYSAMISTLFLLGYKTHQVITDSDPVQKAIEEQQRKARQLNNVK